MSFIPIRTEDSPVWINVDNIMCVLEREHPHYGKVPVLVMMNHIQLACVGSTYEEIMESIHGAGGPREITPIPDAILNSFGEAWGEDETTFDEMHAEEHERLGLAPPEVDKADDDPVIYKDGGDEDRSDEDLLPS